MRLVLKSKQLDEREIDGSALADQVHVSPYDVRTTITNIITKPKLASYNRDHSKPYGLYTSSAVKVGKMLQSDWYGFMNEQQFGKAECIILLKVDPSARLEEVKSRDEYLELVDKYGKNPIYTRTYFGTTNLNFDPIAKDFDGFRITKKAYREIEDLSYGWDVEQCVWFNNKVLTPVPVRPESEIKSPKDSPEYMKEKYDFLTLFDKEYPTGEDY